MMYPTMLRNEHCILRATSPFPGKFADVSKGDVSCLHNVFREVVLYTRSFNRNGEHVCRGFLLSERFALGQRE